MNAEQISRQQRVILYSEDLQQYELLFYGTLELVIGLYLD